MYNTIIDTITNYKMENLQILHIKLMGEIFFKISNNTIEKEHNDKIIQLYVITKMLKIVVMNVILCENNDNIFYHKDSKIIKASECNEGAYLEMCQGYQAIDSIDNIMVSYLKKERLLLDEKNIELVEKKLNEYYEIDGSYTEEDKIIYSNKFHELFEKDKII